MKRIVAAIAACLATSGCASGGVEAPSEQAPPGQFIPQALIDKCEAEGGCVLISKERMREMLAEQRKAVAEEAKAACWANTKQENPWF